MAQSLFIFLLLFLFSCDPPKKKDVTVPTDRQVLSKSCSKGNLRISKKSLAGVSLNDLKQGESVTIKGQTNQGNPCLGNSGFRFECEATVTVDTNRIFQCRTGKIFPLNPSAISSGVSSFQTRPMGSYHTAPSYITHINVQSGWAMIYDNGTKFSVRVEFPNPLLPPQMRTSQCMSGAHGGFGNQCCQGGYGCP